MSRFIPARAGNTFSQNLGVKMNTVYPRSRGEHSSEFCHPPTESGLSPLPRGTHGCYHCYHCYHRFIPARAGNTTTVTTLLLTTPVYPRSRGEHKNDIFQLVDISGLSPLVRGTLIKRVALADLKRFIPARAGNTSFVFKSGSSHAVYPRSCGEH